MQRLDPRDPLVVDTHEVGRSPGTQRSLRHVAAAPADLGVEFLGVPEGARLEIDLRLEAVLEGILVTGEVDAPLEGECVRCLEPLADRASVDFQELYLYEDHRDASSIEDDEEVSVLVGDLVDLEPVLRDAIVLALPLQPLCRPDCPGLCVECGARLADDPEHGHDAPIDPRWAGLAGLADGQE